MVERWSTLFLKKFRLADQDGLARSTWKSSRRSAESSRRVTRELLARSRSLVGPRATVSCYQIAISCKLAAYYILVAAY